MTSTLEHFTADTTVQDLIDNPKKYGVPSFQEFVANPERWRMDLMSIIDGSDPALARMIKKQTYSVCGHDCGQSLARAEAMAQDMGYDIRQMIWAPEVRDLGGQRIDLNVDFKPNYLQRPR